MMKFFINFLLSNVFFFLISSQIVYEFNRDFELNEKMTEEEIYLKLSYNDIYTYIKIGKQEKQLKVGLSFKDKALVILGSEIKNREVFDETKSDSYTVFNKILWNIFRVNQNFFLKFLERSFMDIFYSSNNWLVCIT